MRRLAIVLPVILGLCFTVSAVQKNAGSAKGKIEIIAPSSESVIWIDGVSHGKAGEKRTFSTTIATGTHHVRVRTVGLQDWNREIIVSSARPADLHVTQTKLENDAILHLQKGDAARENNNQEEAVKEYHEAIDQRNGTFPEAYVGLARSLFAQSNSEDAADAAKKAIEQKPGYAEAHTVLANIYRQQGDYDSAAKEYQESIRLSRGFSPEGHTGLGLTYKEVNRNSDAIKELQIGIKQNADTEPLLYYLIGDLYEKQDDNAKAIAAYEAYLKLAPDGKLASALRSMIPQMKKDLQVNTAKP
ncbi:MAG TPA: tetratricopeptide repeat protein [Blastocatellia bacterium]|nr:tetratricopeptide repeat protein [Blastocatellia bacterium]